MSTENTTLNGASLNIAEQRKQELKQLFPGVFTETRNDQLKANAVKPFATFNQSQQESIDRIKFRTV